MDQYELIRTAHRVYKKSIRQIARETGHTRRTVRKVLAGQEPRKCANLSWKLKRLQTLWFDGIGRNNIKPVRERSRDEESVTFGEKTQEEASTG